MGFRLSESVSQVAAGLRFMTSTQVPRRFRERLIEANVSPWRERVEILQVNLGKRCNQACHHCHVEAGPLRTEVMEKRTVDRLLELISTASDIRTVDLTGGAPELNEHFRYFVSALRKLGKKVIDRCNLTVIYEEGQTDLPEFLRTHNVEIVASLPCYLGENVDAQRGLGTFGKSIDAIRRLNSVGYGIHETGLVLNLVYNPLGPHLPPDQRQLEATYKEHLWENYGIRFNALFTLTNMPINRFAHQLMRQGAIGSYMSLLYRHFSSAAARNVMCKTLLSVGWDGKLYDCDFNQMLELPLRSEKTIWDIDDSSPLGHEIVFGDHCFGCTAGNGSSCGGALIEEVKDEYSGNSYQG